MSEEHAEKTHRDVANDSPSFDDILVFIRMVSEHMREFGLTSVDVERPGSRIRLRTATPPTQGSHNSAAPIHHVEPAAGEEPAPQLDDADFIFAPMIGTFYSSPGPGEPVFVVPGDEIEIGQTIGIIEAMKIMNEIAADRAGIVEEVLVRNAQAVEYGQPLLRLSLLEGV